MACNAKNARIFKEINNKIDSLNKSLSSDSPSKMQLDFSLNNNNNNINNNNSSNST